MPPCVNISSCSVLPPLHINATKLRFHSRTPRAKKQGNGDKRFELTTSANMGCNMTERPPRAQPASGKARSYEVLEDENTREDVSEKRGWRSAQPVAELIRLQPNRPDADPAG